MASNPGYKKVLVVDLDPQFNCSQYLIRPQRMRSIISNGEPTIWDIFEQHTIVPGKPTAPFDPSQAVVHVRTMPKYAGGRRVPGEGSLDLIPSRLELSQTLRNASGKERLLKQAVEQLEENYDLVLIDCAPTDSILTTAAYFVADYILVPVRPEFLSTIGLPLLGQSLNQFAAQHASTPPEVLGIVFNDVSDYGPEEVTSQREVRQIANQSGWTVFDTRIRASRSYPRGAREGTPISQTPNAQSEVKENFKDFAREFARRIGT